MNTTGSRAQVMHGTAKHTSGGLTKKDLKYNKQGKIVSKKLSRRAKKEKRLSKSGYTTKKGSFGAFKDGKCVYKGTSKRKSKRKSKRSSRKRISKRISKRNSKRNSKRRSRRRVSKRNTRRRSKQRNSRRRRTKLTGGMNSTPGNPIEQLGDVLTRGNEATESELRPQYPSPQDESTADAWDDATQIGVEAAKQDRLLTEQLADPEHISSNPPMEPPPLVKMLSANPPSEIMTDDGAAAAAATEVGEEYDVDAAELDMEGDMEGDTSGPPPVFDESDLMAPSSPLPDSISKDPVAVASLTPIYNNGDIPAPDWWKRAAKKEQ